MAKCFRNAPIHYKHINGHVDVIMMKLYFLTFSSFQKVTDKQILSGLDKTLCLPVPAVSGALGAREIGA